ncbi:hypothetical protein LOAG_07483 [Loa loa]|uniref:Uncharacterized protein n=1 Tax=Loa loa TaxID=7209 RepID=A0A1S0TX69_LOALO|nr:hypothetical protein LOAG_07483 [Loa loa]EFO21004.1 hypothetical protein LOAG_07483 [Loa loa]
MLQPHELTKALILIGVFENGDVRLTTFLELVLCVNLCFVILSDYATLNYFIYLMVYLPSYEVEVKKKFATLPFAQDTSKNTKNLHFICTSHIEARQSTNITIIKARPLNQPFDLMYGPNYSALT